MVTCHEISIIYIYLLFRLTQYLVVNRLTMEFISGCAHPGSGIDSVFLSSDGGCLQNVAMA